MNKTMVSVVIGLMMSIAIGAILTNNLSNMLEDQKTWDNSTGTPTGSSLEFNNTVDSIISYTWITFGLLALSILIVGAVFVLQQVGML